MIGLLSSEPDVLFFILFTRGAVYYLVHPTYYLLSSVPDHWCTAYYLVFPMYYLLSSVLDVLCII